jgi:hypothetical protein
MNPALKNILAVIVGLIIGGIVNMAIVILSSYLIPPPTGVNVTSMESINANLHLYQPKHFLLPFLAHAIGTLVGAIITAKMAKSKNLLLAILIGLFYLVGGIENFRELPNSPTWFIAVDLILAYIPMGYLGGKLMTTKK